MCAQSDDRPLVDAPKRTELEKLLAAVCVALLLALAIQSVRLWRASDILDSQSNLIALQQSPRGQPKQIKTP